MATQFQWFYVSTIHHGRRLPRVSHAVGSSVFRVSDIRADFCCASAALCSEFRFSAAVKHFVEELLEFLDGLFFCSSRSQGCRWEGEGGGGHVTPECEKAYFPEALDQYDSTWQLTPCYRAKGAPKGA